MRKRRRNITIVNNEIDYDKLAEAIVNAQNNTRAKKKNTSKLRSAAMSFFNGAIYSTVYFLAGLSIYVIWAESYAKQSASLVGCIILTAILAFIGIYAFLCQQESFQDKDSDTREHFNINISLVALVVA
ncbi:MAG: hypothetical protein J6K88_02385, partial [Oscillospiraceae bacterium]|nr:hypothetical protein [Oscillospiraceae bacterium]